jgi:hypothetical protein
MERGLALWTDRTQRFYPTATLRAHGNALIDADAELSALKGRRALVYLNPGTGAPACLYTEALHCSWQGDTLVLDTGEHVRGAALFDPNGVLRAASRPVQSLTCWYSYAFTFPGGEIYAD